MILNDSNVPLSGACCVELNEGRPIQYPIQTGAGLTEPHWLCNTVVIHLSLTSELSCPALDLHYSLPMTTYIVHTTTASSTSGWSPIALQPSSSTIKFGKTTVQVTLITIKEVYIGIYVSAYNLVHCWHLQKNSPLVRLGWGPHLGLETVFALWLYTHTYYYTPPQPSTSTCRWKLKHKQMLKCNKQNAFVCYIFQFVCVPFAGRHCQPTVEC